MITACTIIARNYLAHARVLADSFLTHHPSSLFHVLIIDDERGFTVTRDEGFDCLRLRDIGLTSHDIGRLAGACDVGGLATSVKPALLAHLLGQSDHVVYLDPDIVVYGSLEEVVPLARAYDVVLTPHILEALPRDGRSIDAQAIIANGIYDLGFLGVGREARPFLQWWWEAARDGIAGTTTAAAPRWLDLAPSFSRHHLLRDAGYSVGYWNLHERDLQQSDGRLLVNGRSLRCFHFSGFDPRVPHLLSAHQGDQPRILLSERPVLRRLCQDYADKLKRAGFDESMKREYGWSTLPGGAAVDRRIRRLYANALQAHEREQAAAPPNPFDQDDPDAFVTWLNQPGADGPRSVSRYELSIYRDRADLQRHFPDLSGKDAVRYQAWLRTDGVVEEHISAQLLRDRERLAPRTFAPPSTLRAGLNVAGYLNAELGIGEAARLMIRTLDHAGVPHSTLTYDQTANRKNHEFVPRGDARAEFDINLVCVNADRTPHFVRDIGRSFFAGRHTVGYWFWELEHFPDSLYPGFDCVDEVWAASEFVTASIRSANRRPAHTLPIPVLVPDVEPTSTRERFGLPDSFVFLFIFDFFSFVERKNPIGLIEAFARAFRPGEGPVLMLKSINGHKRVADLEALRFAIGDRRDIRLVDEYYSAAEKNALIALSDCYVSLHRSEGWGLTMAEAMALGKPVIATGYSGNLDFMTTENSFLVDYVTGTVPAGCEPYTAGTRWAEPSLDSAAALMRRVFEQPEEAMARGRLARTDILTRHGLESCAAILNRRVDAIHASMKKSVRVPRTADTPPASSPSDDQSVDRLLESATALLTPQSGLPSTARLRSLRLPLQRGLLRALRTYWWQQRQLQSLILEALRRVQARAAGHELEAESQVADLRGRVESLERRTRSQADDLRGRASSLETRTQLMQSALDRLAGLEAKVGGFQSRAADHLHELEKHLGDVAHETRTLADRLYAKPYVSDSRRFAQTDALGRPALGFDAPGNGLRSVYSGFEDIFRGTEQLIHERAQVYVGMIGSKAPVLDVGSGRGELLEALRDAGISARGLDVDEGMVARCRAKGLDVIQADALEFLATEVQDNSLGAMVAVQVIEHLTYSNLIDFLRLARQRLAPGGVLIAETVNPHSIEAFRTFWTDLTHQAPIFPEVALALSDLQGFSHGRIVFPFGSGDLEEDRKTCGEYALIATK